MDLLAAIAAPLVILPGGRALVPTGLRLALKHGAILPNTPPGTIDEEFCATEVTRNGVK